MNAWPTRAESSPAGRETTARRRQRDTLTMPPLLDRAVRLWTDPLPAGDDALGAFRAVYADPLVVNGTVTDVRVLVDRAAMMKAAFADLESDVHEIVEAPGRLSFAFRLTGRHVGPLETPVGVLAPTG